MPHDVTYEPPEGEAPPAGSALMRAPARDLVTEPPREPVSLRDVTFAKSGTKPLTKVQAKTLRKQFEPRKEIEILITGEVYVSHVHVRRRLNDAVGPMGWALRPISEVNIHGAKNQMFREYALIVLGRVVATAFGSAKYFPNNDRLDYADTAEAVKSNALTRCCKDLGIASECWDRDYCDTWRDQFAVKVWVREKQRKKDGNGRWVDAGYENVPRWRKYTARPLQGELDICSDSPNQDKWRAQMERWTKMLAEEAEKSREVFKKLQSARKDLALAKKEEQLAASQPQQANGAESAPRQPAQQSAPEKTEPAKQPEVVQGGAPPKPSAPIQHPNAVAPDDRPYLVRTCKIVERTPEFTLHMITMMNGSEYFTFSKRVYAEFQGYMASRQKVQVRAQEQKSKGKSFMHIGEWKELASGAVKK
jgi:hypothetical protein